MGDYKVEFRDLGGSKTTVMDLRKGGNLIISSTGDSKKVAVHNAMTTLQTRVELGKQSEQAVGFLTGLKEGLQE
jgi:hypothetical protein